MSAKLTATISLALLTTWSAVAALPGTGEAGTSVRQLDGPGSKHPALVGSGRLNRLAITAQPGTRLKAPFVEIFRDTFEGSGRPWWPDASYGYVDSLMGKVYQPVSGWAPNSENHFSPSHSWWNPDTVSQQLDLLLSPTIILPESLTIRTISRDLIGAFISHKIDIDASSGEIFEWYAGIAQSLWAYRQDDVFSGGSAWWLKIPDVPAANPSRHWLVTPTLDLGSVPLPISLAFAHKFNSEPQRDYFSVEVSDDAFQSYTTLAAYSGSVGTGGYAAWTVDSLDLSPWAGDSVRIRFSAKMDFNTIVFNTHWKLDDILVADGDGDTLLYDGGGEDETTSLTQLGWLGGGTGSPTGGLGTWTAPVPSPAPQWSDFQEPNSIFMGASHRIDGGDSIRLALRWDSDEEEEPGRGIFIDDVTLLGSNLFDRDVALIGANGLLTATIDEPFNPRMLIMNAGADTLTTDITWAARIFDEQERLVAEISGEMGVNEMVFGDEVFVETAPAERWTPDRPGRYTLSVNAGLADGTDEDRSNNSAAYPFEVFGPPFSQVVYRTDFAPNLGEQSLGDLGWTVVNAGGDSAGGNQNSWELSRWIYGQGAVISGWFNYPRGSLDEALDEQLVSPAIDLSGVEPNAQLFLNAYLFFRTGHFHPSVSDSGFGTKFSRLTVDFSTDQATWTNVFKWTDDDTVGDDNSRYLPPGGPMATTDMDISGAVGAAQVWVRFGFVSEDSRVFGINVDNVLVYQGPGRPEITEVSDIPQDQGGQVRVSWLASFNDGKLYQAGTPYVITHYDLWRQVPQIPPPGRLDPSASVRRFLELFRTEARFEVGDRVQIGESEEAYDFIATIPARSSEQYNFVSPTLQDSLETRFMVSAHTSNPLVYVHSLPVAGASIDNLPPGAPTGLHATEEDSATVQLTWRPPVEESVRHYSVYRRTPPDAFGVAPLAVVQTLLFTDKSVEPFKTYAYAVSATDFAGHESEKSEEVSLVISHVEVMTPGGIVPDAFEVLSVRPNPVELSANTHQIVIEFQTPNAGMVQFAIYNLLGQQIWDAEVSLGSAGSYQVGWDLRDQFGRRVPGGIYFYTASLAGAEHITGKFAVVP